MLHGNLYKYDGLFNTLVFHFSYQTVLCFQRPNHEKICHRASCHAIFEKEKQEKFINLLISILHSMGFGQLFQWYVFAMERKDKDMVLTVVKIRFQEISQCMVLKGVCICLRKLRFWWSGMVEKLLLSNHI